MDTNLRLMEACEEAVRAGRQVDPCCRSFAQITVQSVVQQPLPHSSHVQACASRTLQLNKEVTKYGGALEGQRKGAIQRMRSGVAPLTRDCSLVSSWLAWHCHMLWWRHESRPVVRFARRELKIAFDLGKVGGGLEKVTGKSPKHCQILRALEHQAFLPLHRRISGRTCSACPSVRGFQKGVRYRLAILLKMPY